MTLSLSQRNHVDICIEYLFPDEIKANTENFKRVFSNKADDTLTEEPLKTLQKCVRHPQGFLNPLETMSEEKITVGDVQTYILCYVTKKLSGIPDEQELEEDKVKPFLDSIDWNKDAILAKLKEEKAFTQEFKSDPTSFTWGEINTAPPPEPRLYTYQLVNDDVVNDNNIYYSYHIEATITLSPELKVNQSKYIPNLQAYHTTLDRDEAKLKYKFANSKAKELAVKVVLMYLIEKKIISPTEAKTVPPFTRDLLTYSYCYNLIATKACEFKEITQLTQSERDNLTYTPIISLIESGRCSIPLAKKLNVEQRKILDDPIYHANFSTCIDMSELYDITAENPCRNIFSSHVKQLVDKKVITFGQAKKITTPCRLLLDNTTYFELIKSGKIPFTAIENITTDQSINLNTLSVTYLISQQNFPLAQALNLNLTATQQAVLDNEIYFKAVQHNKNYFFSLLSYTDEQCRNLLDNSILVSKGILSYEEAYTFKMPAPCKAALDSEFYQKVLDKNNFSFFLSLTEDQSKALLLRQIKRLIDEKIFTPSEIVALNISPACCLLLKNDFFFNLVKKNKNYLSLLAPISEDQRKNLLTKTIQNLLFRKKIKLEDAITLSLSDSCRAILDNPNYLRLIKEDKLDIKFILSLSERQRQFLLNPNLIHFIKFDTIKLDRVWMAIKNPVMLDLIEHDVLNMRHLNEILPTQSYTPPNDFKFDTYDEHQLRRVIKPFMKLAKAGLLSEKDLPILCNNFAKLDPTDAKMHDSKDETSTCNAASLLQDQNIMDACKEALLRRLDAINHFQPTVLPDGEDDDLNNIINSLEEFDIRSEEIWIRVFSMRIMAVAHHSPFILDLMEDDLDDIKTDIDKYIERGNNPTSSNNYMTDESNILSAQFRQKVIKNIFERAVDHIKSILAGKEAELGEIHNKISGEYDNALKQEAEAKNDDSMLWPKAFANIIVVCQDALMSLRKDFFNFRSDEQRKRLKTQSTFFQPKSHLRDFCKTLIGISDVLDYFEPSYVVPAAEATSSGSSNSSSTDLTFPRKRGFSEI